MPGSLNDQPSWWSSQCRAPFWMKISTAPR